MTASISLHVPQDAKLFPASDALSHANSKCTTNNTPLAVKVTPDSNAGSEMHRGGKDQTAMTIEFLRARLLSERAASRAAREEVRRNAKRVLQLQSQLLREIEERKKAEAAAEETVTELRLKGLDTASFSSSGQDLNSSCSEDLKESLSESESEKLCQEVSLNHIQEEVKICTVSLKCDEREDAKCDEREDATCQAIGSAVGTTLLESQKAVASEGINSPHDGFESERLSHEVSSNLMQGIGAISTESAEKNGQTCQIISSRDYNSASESHKALSGEEICTHSEIMNDDSIESNKDQSCPRRSDVLNRSIDVEADLNKNGDELREMIELNERQDTREASAQTMLLPSNNQDRERRLETSKRIAVKEQLQQLEEEIAALAEDRNEVHFVRLKLQDMVNHLTNLLGENLQEDQNSDSFTRSARSYMKPPLHEGARQRPQIIEVENSCVHKHLFKSENSTTKKVSDIRSKSISSSGTCCDLDSSLHHRGRSDERTVMSSPSDFPSLRDREVLEGFCPTKLRKADKQLEETDHPRFGSELQAVRETVNSGFDVVPEEKQIVKGTEYSEVPVAAFHDVQDVAHFEHDLKMGGGSFMINSRHRQIHNCRNLSDYIHTENGQCDDNVFTGEIRTDWSTSHVGFLKPHYPVVDELPSHINKSTDSVGSFYQYDSSNDNLGAKREIDATVCDKALRGTEKGRPSRLASLPCREKELTLRSDNHNGTFYRPKGEYQFSSEIHQNGISHLSMAGSSNNIPIAQTSKVFEEGKSRLEGILAELCLVKQHIRSSIDPQCLDYNGGKPMNGCGEGAYYVTSPSRVGTHVTSFAMEGEPFSYKLPSYGAVWCSPQAVNMQIPISTTFGTSNLRRSKAIAETIAMPYFETYYRPRRKVHLGNGISLYTD